MNLIAIESFSRQVDIRYELYKIMPFIVNDNTPPVPIFNTASIFPNILFGKNCCPAKQLHFHLSILSVSTVALVVSDAVAVVSFVSVVTESLLLLLTNRSCRRAASMLAGDTVASRVLVFLTILPLLPPIVSSFIVGRALLEISTVESSFLLRVSKGTFVVKLVVASSVIIDGDGGGGGECRCRNTK